MAELQGLMSFLAAIAFGYYVLKPLLRQARELRNGAGEADFFGLTLRENFEQIGFFYVWGLLGVTVLNQDPRTAMVLILSSVLAILMLVVILLRRDSVALKLDELAYFLTAVSGWLLGTGATVYVFLPKWSWLGGAIWGATLLFCLYQALFVLPQQILGARRDPRHTPRSFEKQLYWYFMVMLVFGSFAQDLWTKWLMVLFYMAVGIEHLLLLQILRPAVTGASNVRR